jgi:hypothetical protein
MSAPEADMPVAGGASVGPPPKIPIAQCWAAGWSLLFTKAHHWFALVWIPALGVFLMENSAGFQAAMTAKNVGHFLPYLVAEIFLYSLIATGAYAVAFGRARRLTLARLEIGGPELRFLLAKLIFWLILFALLLGAYIIGQQLLIILRDSNKLLSAASNSADDATWLSQLTWLGRVAVFGPYIFVGVIFAWFGTRFALVFPQAMIGPRLNVLKTMALTKGNSWRLTALFRHLGGQVLIVSVIASTVLVAVALVPAAPPKSSAGEQYSVGRAAALVQPAQPKIPSWAQPLVTVVLGTIWQIVFAGALARGYRSVKPDQE